MYLSIFQIILMLTAFRQLKSNVITTVKCTSSQFKCTGSQRCIPKDQVCDFINNCKDKSDEKNCGSCEFENGLCGWQLDKVSSAQRWRLISASSKTAPKIDMTISMDGGHFIGSFNQNSKDKKGIPSKIIANSPVIGPTSSDCKLSFGYNIQEDAEIGTNILVKVKYAQASGATLITKILKSTKSKWKTSEIPLPNIKKRIEISFTAMFTIGTTNIALDDIVMDGCGYKGVETAGISCNFSKNFCEWTQKQDLWNRQKPPIDNGGPKLDHDQKLNYFIYLKVPNNNPPIKAHLTSKQIPKQSEKHCLTFWSYMFGDVGHLQVTMIRNYTNEDLFLRSGSFGNEWKRVAIDIPPASDPFKIQIEGYCTKGTIGGIAIADINYGIDKCPSKFDFSDFQDELSWTDKDKKWFVTNGRRNALIKKDHTWRNELGNFAMSTTGNSLLTSPNRNVWNEQVCFSFWTYKVSKSDFISVSLIFPSLDPPIEVYNDSKFQTVTNVWHRVQKTIDFSKYSKSSYKISIESHCENSVGSAVAIDDISIEPEQCSSRGSCSFEVNMCDWAIKESPEYARWLRISPYMYSKYFGPKHDVTINSNKGWYLLVKTQSSNIDKQAIVESDYFYTLKTMCFSFYYIISDKGIGTLDVALSSPSAKTRIIRSVTKETKDWKQVLVPIEDENLASKIFNLKLQANIKKAKGYIAIDDISVSSSCHPTVAPPVSPIPLDQFSCDFESTCSWVTSPNMIYFKPDGNKCPMVDHTKRSVNGHFLKVSNYGSSHASLELQNVPYHTTGFCLKFWYFISTTNIQSAIIVSFKKSDKGSNVPIWKAFGRQDHEWKLFRIHITPDEKITDIKINFFANDVKNDCISIDDLTLIRGKCPELVQSCSLELKCPNLVFEEGWKIKNVLSISQYDKDHTINSNSGHVIVFESILTTSSFYVTKIKKGTNCVKFWYKFYSKQKKFQEIIVGSKENIESDKFTHWKTIKDVGEPRWMLATITIQEDYEHVISITAQKLPHISIMIDDLEITKGMCQDPGSCNFENGHKCNWFNEDASNTQWTVVNSKQLSRIKAPKKDMTTGTPEGYFLMLQSTSSKYVLSSLISEFFDMDFYRKISFYYYIEGGGKLEVIVQDTDGEHPVKHPSLKSGKDWELFESNLEDKKNFHIALKASLPTPNDFVAIDEIQIASQETPFKKQSETFDCKDGKKIQINKVCNFVKDCSHGLDEASCGTCDFEQDLCGWKLIKQDASVGTALISSASSDKTPNHPKADHSKPKSDQGKYLMFTKQSKDIEKRTKLTAMMRDSSPTCHMTLWLATSNTASSSINIYVVVGGIRGLRYRDNSLISITNSWSQIMVDIGSISGDFQVLIEPSTFEYIAIDDIKFEKCAYPPVTKGKCPSGQMKCKNSGICIDEAALCDTVNDCGDLSDESGCDQNKYCTLEYGSEGCFWTPLNISSSSYEWVITERQFDGDYGPATDHTLGLDKQGSYYYTSSQTWDFQGYSTFLMSNTINMSKETGCKLRFFYYMFGKNVGSLRVQFQSTSSNKLENILEITGNQGQKWVKGSADFPKGAKSGKFIFSAVIQESGFSAIALDDITLSKDCQIDPENEFFCESGSPASIHESGICDFKNDCSDGSDEDHCPLKCDFDDGGFCNWVPFPKEYVRVVTASKYASTVKHIPDSDHTSHSGSGKYLVLDHGKSVTISKISINSPVLQHSADGCLLRFWFYTSSSAKISLKYETQQIGEKKELEIGYINDDYLTDGHKWQQMTIGIGRRRKKFSLRISSILRLGIDDISLENCALPKTGAKCSSSQFKCKSGACINQNQRCDLSDDCGDNSDEEGCSSIVSMQETFEDSSKIKFHTLGRRDSWKLSTVVAERTPAYDHTLTNSKGHFMVTSFRYTLLRKEIYLISDNVFGATKSGSTCRMTFFYSMFEKNSKRLTVKVKYFENDNNYYDIWSVDGFKGQMWNRKQLDISQSKPFKVIFAAYAHDDYNDQLAIDDITFTSGCKIMGGKLPDDNFKCLSGSPMKVPKSFVCDYKKDCQDGSDENDCPSKCDFEEGDACNWSTSPQDHIEVVNASGVSHSQVMIPKYDHTAKNSSGYFWFINTKVETNAISPIFRNSATYCILKFWFVTELYPLKVTLNYKDPDDGKDRSMIIGRITPGDKKINNNWQEAKIGIGRRRGSLSISINKELILPLSIDDIEFDGCALPKAEASCLESQFKCERTGACIEKSQVCDLSDNCGDNSDEGYCFSRYTMRETFEYGLSIYFHQPTNIRADVSHWKIASSSDHTTPAYDHTLLNTKGHFMVTNFHYGVAQNREAWLLTTYTYESNSNSSPCSLTFYYTMFDRNAHKLGVYVSYYEDGSKLETKWIDSGYKGQMWIRKRLDFVENQPFKIAFIAYASSSYTGQIAIDDVTLNKGCKKTAKVLPKNQFKCTSGKIQNIYGNYFCDFKSDCSDGSDEKSCPSMCNFENGEMCNWSPSSKNAVRAVKASDIPTPATGVPRTDHTTSKKSGHFLLFQTKKGENPNDLSIKSPQFHNSSAYCILKFWYDTAAYPLNVSLEYIDPIDGEARSFRVGYISSDNSVVKEDWQQAKIGIGRRNFAFSITISTGGILPLSIDDIKFDGCALPKPEVRCQKNQFNCKRTGACIEMSRVCDLTDDCGDNSDEHNCYSLLNMKETFENHPFTLDFYQPTNINSDVSNWKLSNSNGQSTPAYDHTLLNPQGHFMMTDFQYNVDQNRQAWLMTKYLYGTTSKKSPCSMTFYYSMFDINSNKLGVYATYYKDGSDLEERWIDSGYKGQMWLRQRLDFVENKPFKIVFIAYATSGYSGQIAIDDVSLSSGCRVDGKSLPHNTFNCTSGSVKDISGELVCDFKSDCSDHSDESGCPSQCNFEDGNMCNWSSSSSKAIQVVKASDSPLSDKYIPKLDHTSSQDNGHFLLFQRTGTLSLEEFSIRSPSFHNSAAYCILKFWFITETYPLKVFLSYTDPMYEEPKVMKIGLINLDNNNVKRNWQQAKIGVGRRKGGFTIRISTEALLPLSIDDIKFDGCALPKAMASCLESQFKCESTGACIEKSRVCDLSDDCGDNSDELRCYLSMNKKETFEEDPSAMIFHQLSDLRPDVSNWKLASPSNQSSPAYDHTYLNTKGHFMMTDFQYGVAQNRKALLLSKYVFSPTKDDSPCAMTFYYNMFDINSNKLGIYVSYYEDGSNLVEQWIDYGYKGQMWIRKRLEFIESKPFKIVFIAYASSGFNGQMAIDDVIFESGCRVSGTDLPHDSFNCKSGNVKHISGELVCDFKSDCSDGSDEIGCPYQCDFEDDGNCNWSPSSKKAITLFRASDTPTPATGVPKIDHTTSKTSGHFLLFQRKGGLSLKELSIKSPKFHNSAAYCIFQFWFVTETYPLKVFLDYVDPIDGSSKSMEIGHINSDDNHVSKDWQQAKIGVGRRKGGFTVRINSEAVQPLSIDDIIFDGCALPKSKTMCYTDEFECQRTGACIKKSRVCDLSDDCGDNSDEDKCYSSISMKETFEEDPSAMIFHQLPHLRSDGTNWKLSSPNNQSSPAYDHTLLNTKGHFMMTNFQYGVAQNRKASLQMKSVFGPTKDGSSCSMNFYYSMFDINSNKLGVYVSYYEDGSNLVEQWIDNGYKGQMWIHQRLEFVESKPFKIIFIAYASTGYSGQIAIDDVSFGSGCQVIGRDLPHNSFNCISGSIKDISGEFVCDFKSDCSDHSDESGCPSGCNFEKGGMCSWSSNSSKAIQLVKASDTPASTTGVPKIDHTTSKTSGHFLLFQRKGGLSLKELSIASPKFHNSAAYCIFQFWFVTETYPLKVFLDYVDPIDGDSKSLEIGHINSDDNNVRKDWQQAKIGVGRRKGGFTMRISTEALLPLSIDDIQFDGCALPKAEASCLESQFKCQSTDACIEKSRVCDLSDDCGDNSDEDKCYSSISMKETFEEDASAMIFHQLSDLRPDVSNWNLASPSNQSSPAYDHTYLNTKGHFMMTDFQYGVAQNRKALLLSKYVFSPTNDGSPCVMTFYYSMFDINSYILGIYVSYYEDGSNLVQQWIDYGYKGQMWIRKRLEFIESKPFKIVFIAYASSGFNGQIAIDDVTFHHGCLNNGRKLSKNLFSCASGSIKQVYGNFVCDFKSDCKDGSDENGCPSKCDFENGGTCDWSSSSSKAISVFKASDVQKSWIGVPKIDHTTSKASGHFLLFRRINGDISEKLDIISPTFHNSSAYCVLKFWFVTETYPLNVFIDYQDPLDGMHKSIKIGHISSDNNEVRKDWQQAVIGVGRRPSSFSIRIITEGILSLSIDDINFDGCALPKSEVRCLKNQVKCQSTGACIEESRVCDLSDDCGDNSDEDKCYSSISMKETFEEDPSAMIFHQLSHLRSDGTNWKLASPSNQSSPAYDHTLLNTKGHFMMTNFQYGVAQNRKAFLETKYVFSPTKDGSPCAMTFYYSMFDINTNKLGVYVSYYDDRSDQVEKWVESGYKGQMWIRKRLEFTESKPFKIAFIAYASSGFNGQMAIDDVTFHSGCRKTGNKLPQNLFHCASGNINQIYGNSVCDFKYDCSDGSDETGCPSQCDFEDGGNCNWSPSSKKAIRVFRASNAPKSATGVPKIDHTTSKTSGHFLLFQREEDDSTKKLNIKSSKFRNSSSYCIFQFWFVTETYPLRVFLDYVDPIDGGSNSMEIGHINSDDNDVRNDWQQAKIGVGRRKVGFTIRISSEALLPLSIDDIKFDGCALPKSKVRCQNNEFKCQRTGACIEKSRVCDLSDDCGDNSDEQECYSYISNKETFEEVSSASFFQPPKNIKTDHSNWKFATSSDQPSPAYDHTLLNTKGHFMMTDFQYGVAQNRKAFLETKYVISPTKDGSPCAMTFYYSMFDINANKLGVYVSYYDDGSDQVEKWIDSGYKGQMWIRKRLEFTESKPFKIVFIAYASSGFNGQMAIDDVTFDSGCLIAANTLPKYLFNCKSGKIKQIHGNSVCDFKSDCSDGSDEIGCPSQCDFEDGGNCNWSTSSKKTVRVVKVSNVPKLTIGVPKTDHTTSKTSGHFMLFQREDSDVLKELTVKSPKFHESSSYCNLQFWFVTETYPLNVFLDYVEPVDGSSKSLEIGHINSDNNNVRDDWQQAKIGVGRRKGAFTIRISTEALLPLSIDDIKFDGCALPKSKVKCQNNEFKCQRIGACIEKSRVCDLSDDCGDNSDEDKCLSFIGMIENFEEDASASIFQQPMNIKTDLANWKFASSSDQLSPAYDHTLLNTKGHFMMTDFQYSVTQNREAWLQTKYVFSPTQQSSPCSMTFYYSMFDINAQKLGVYAMYFDDGSNLVAKSVISGYKGQMWIRKHLEFVESKPFKIVFIAYASSGFNGQMAIDDVSLNTGCLKTVNKLPKHSKDTNPSTDSSPTDNSLSSTAKSLSGIQEKDKHYGTAEISGIVIGVLILLLGVGGLSYFVFIYIKKREENKNPLMDQVENPMYEMGLINDSEESDSITASGQKGSKKKSNNVKTEENLTPRSIDNPNFQGFSDME